MLALEEHVLGSIGPYRLISGLGAGGMGRVFLAEGDAGQRVALKVVHPHLLERPGYRERFLREVDMGMRVVHPNVVRTLDAGTVLKDGKPVDYLAMEYVEGQTLRALLDDLWRMPEPLCRHVGREVAKGLEAVHAAGILHRDLRPENVLITKDHVVKLMDLGVARLVEESARLSQSGVFVGSVAYAAPEQIRDGGKDIDHRVDLYALGMTLYELACGRHPFPEEEIARALFRQLHEDPAPPSRLEPTLTPFYDEVVLELLARDPDKRFSAAKQVRIVLQEGEASPWWLNRARAVRARTQRPLRRPARAAGPALVGREDELGSLRGLYRLAGLGRGQVALVLGEPGIGKTRLLDELADQMDLESDHPHVLVGGYAPGGAATATEAFASAYRDQFGVEDLDEALRRALRPLPRLVPAFAAVLRGDVPPPGVAPLARESLQAAFVQAARTLSAQRTTVVLIDDLHLAPEEGRAIFAALAFAAREQKLLLVGAGQPESLEAWAAGLEASVPITRVVPQRLHRASLTALLARELASEPLARELAQPLTEASDGNPRFAVEVLRALKESGVLVQAKDGAWTTTRPVRGLRLPDSLAALVKARLASVEPDHRALLEAAACDGLSFDPLEAAAALRLDRLEALQRLRTIEQRHGLVHPRGERYAFDHPQVREALYDSLSAPHRRELHAAYLRVVEDKEGATNRPVEALDPGACARMADHALRGGLGAQALPYLACAVAHLEASHLADAAAGLVARALDAPGLLAGRARAQMLLAQARRLDDLGRPVDVEAALKEAQDLAQAAGDSALEAEVEDVRGSHAVGAGDYGPARAALGRALELAHRGGAPALEARALAHLGVVEHAEGHFEAAETSFGRALEHARTLGDAALERTILADLGATLSALGRLTEGREHLDRHVALAVEAKDRHAEVLGRLALGGVLTSLGDLDAARQELERAWARAREIGYRREEDAALTALGRVLGRLGNAEEGRRHLDRALCLARETGDRATEALALHELGVLEAEDDALGPARERLKEALTLWTALGDGDGEVATRLALARTNLAEAPERARSDLLAALERAAADHLVAGTALARCLLAALPGGDLAAARACLDEHETRLPLQDRVEARLLLWRAGADPADLAAARSRLEDLLAPLPTLERARVAESPLARAVTSGTR